MANIQLDNNDIHLWVCQPQHIHSAELLQAYKALLTPEETTKQQRYRFEKDQHDALITRAFVRDLLSHYANVAPQDWRFEKGEKDKPEIINPPLPLRFNLSHTADMIICAVTLDDDIGADVENIARNNDVLAIADRYFSGAETRELFSLPKTQQRSRFFDYWTLKESYIKACGLGLAIPLGDFTFHIAAAKKANINANIKLSFAPHRIDYPELWRSWIFYPSEDHRASVSIKAQKNNQQQDYRLRFFESTPLISYSEKDNL